MRRVWGSVGTGSTRQRVTLKPKPKARVPPGLVVVRGLKASKTAENRQISPKVCGEGGGGGEVKPVPEKNTYAHTCERGSKQQPKVCETSQNKFRKAPIRWPSSRRWFRDSRPRPNPTVTKHNIGLQAPISMQHTWAHRKARHTRVWGGVGCMSERGKREEKAPKKKCRRRHRTSAGNFEKFQGRYAASTGPKPSPPNVLG